MREVRMRWVGTVGRFMLDETPEIDLEGALSSGKTTACLHKEFQAAIRMPGIHGLICRYGDGETQTKLRPKWDEICHLANEIPAWNAKELSYDFANGSRYYAFGLKSPDQMSRYSKLRGLGVSRMYTDQAEELPEDMSLEMRARLRQENFPHQLTFSPNPPNVTHWLAKQFPDTNVNPRRKYYAVSLYDNAHNLPPSLIADLLAAYPEGHAKHRSVILGKRGLNVTGDPVYKGAFVRAIHIKPVPFSRHAPLLEAIDFGKHHPCVVWAQQPYTGGMHFLGGILGQDLFLDDFLPIVQQQRARWFPDIQSIETCCDPAGAHQNSQGARFNGVDLLRQHGFSPQWRDNANAPDVRLSTIERLAGHMRRRTVHGEAFQVDPDHWLRVTADGPEPMPFLADGFEAGYVWDEHLVSVGSKQVRKPKKDGWYEHGMNCAEYLELNFGADQPTAEQRDAERERLRGVDFSMPDPVHWSAL